MFSFNCLSLTLQNLLLHHVYNMYPEEACGLIFLDNNTREYFVFPIRNIQDSISGENSSNFFFTMDTDFILNIVDKFIHSENYSLACIYHSHTQENVLKMSDLDKENALNERKLPHFPDTSYMIFDVSQEKVKQIHVYKWHSEMKYFKLLENILI